MGVIGLKTLRGLTIMSQNYIKQLYDNVYITKHFCAFLGIKPDMFYRSSYLGCILRIFAKLTHHYRESHA